MNFERNLHYTILILIFSPTSVSPSVIAYIYIKLTMWRHLC